MTDLAASRAELRSLGFDADGLDAGARAMYDSLTDEEVGSLCAIVRGLAAEPDVEGFRMRRRELDEHEQTVSENVRALAMLYSAQREEQFEAR